MALFLPVTSTVSAQESFKITSAIQRDGYTVYEIKVLVSPFTWTCQHRYSEFRDLHEKMVANFGVDKSVFPKKKIFGNQNDQFIVKRQAELEFYLQTLVQRLSILPDPLSTFLEFQNYEVRCIVDKLSEMLYFQGDEILANGSEFSMSPLQLHALSERLKLPEPTCASGDKKKDIGHALAFISELKNLTIKGSNEAYGTSNIIPNSLPYDLTPFKSLLKLTVYDSCLKGNLKDLSSLRNTVTSIIVRNSLEDLASALLGDVTHWSPMDSQSYWPWWRTVVQVDFSHNKITSIDPCIKLLPSLESLDLSFNLISSVENLESLPHLSRLNLSNNHICHLDALHTRLGNVKTLLLAGNYISSLRGLSRLYSLIKLDLSQNQVSEIKEVENLGSLPCLEDLNLSSNPVTSVLDYRPNVLLAFVPRAAEILLDKQKVTQKELDTVSVLQALQAAREGRILRHSSFYDSSNPRIDTTTNTGRYNVVYPRESRNEQPDFPECSSIQFDPHTEEFRQQVAALRRLGGNDWLRLLNQLQKESRKPGLDISNSNKSTTKKVATEIGGGLAQSKSEVSSSVTENPRTEREIPCERIGQTCCYYSGRSTNGNILLPDWLNSITLSIFKFRSQVLQEIEKDEENRIVCETPVWSTWVLIVTGNDYQLKRFPACFLLTSNNIYILEIRNFNCQKTQDFLQNQPEIVLKLDTRLQANNVKYAVTGYNNNYLEIHCSGLEETQKIVIYTKEGHMQGLISKLRSHYGFQIESKYALEDIYDHFQHAAIHYDKQTGSVLAGHFGPRLKILACEVICKVEVIEDDPSGPSKHWQKRQNALTFLVVTQNLVLIMEESLILSLKGTAGPFKMLLKLDVDSYVKGIHMKDVGASHSCCPSNKTDNSGATVTENSCFLHELYTCGYWLLIDFEGNSSLKVRFLCREARSRFLEAFLSSRNQKM